LTFTHAAGASTIDAESYAYDPVGKRAGHSAAIGQSLLTQPTTNQYNVGNQLTLFGPVPDSYDANGNLVQEGTTTAYMWDSRNRLKSIVTAAGQTTNFTYDFAGDLIAQSDSGTSLNLTKYFVLDDITNMVYESASDGTSYSVLSGRSIDSHLAIIQPSGEVQYRLSDAVNSTVATVDQTGAVKSQFFYDAFGQTTTTSLFPFQFTGRIPISARLYNYRARFYRPATGRFISEDPIGFAAGPNLYAYALDNPIIFIDSLGLDVENGGNPGKTLWGCGQATYNAYTNCRNGGQNIGAGGVLGGTGDMGTNQTVSMNPYMNPENGNLPTSGSLSFSQLHNGLQNSPGTPGQDIGQCLSDAIGVLKSCVLPLIPCP
jgi:RHS repeat-associated protein